MVDSHAENIVIKEDWYDLTKYKDELRTFILNRRPGLGNHQMMFDNYEYLYRAIYSGAEEADKERYTSAKETFNVYKAALIEACLPGYSALLDVSGRDAYSTLLAPKTKAAMIEQLKAICAVEKLSDQPIFDWILKGEVVLFINLKTTTEKFREKSTVSDAETGKDIIQFKVETGVTYDDLDIEVIDPFDFYVDAMDYAKDPKGTPKIIRSFISSKELLTNKSDYPLLTEYDKQCIIKKKVQRETGYPYVYSGYADNSGELTYSKTTDKQIEVLTYRGDYVTKDGKLLTNIKVRVVEDQLAFVDYSGVDTCQIIYAPYIIDRDTHRGVSPLASIIPINELSNKCIDLFVSNMDEVGNPILLFPKGSVPANQQRTFRASRMIEFNETLGSPIQWFNPPEISPNGMILLQNILQQNKDMLGLNNYISGDTSGSVRTAQESQILFQKANARMRVETDVFSYKVLLPLMVNFYAFNRELALACNHPLKDIYADPRLAISISTGAAKADKEGERLRLMEMLNLPLMQMIASNWTPEQASIALRYLMAKDDITDFDNILELFDDKGNPTYASITDENEQGIPPQLQERVNAQEEQVQDLGMNPDELSVLDQIDINNIGGKE